jgi:pimeloyl-ACP methyl ester carboxylesterase
MVTTKYAKSGDVYIAYQVVGTGPRDLVFVPGWVSNLDYAWEDPHYSHFLKRLASFSRLILMDRRGTGLSDRISALPTLEERMDDVRAVMDAAGSKRAVLFGLSEGGPMCMLFAATYPERTSSLILYGTFARLLHAPDYPFGVPVEVMKKFLDWTEEVWGTGTLSTDVFAPSCADDVKFRESWAKFERLAVSPSGIRTLLSMIYNTDARQAMTSIHVPTLIIHRVGDQIAPLAAARYMAEHIPDATLIEVAGVDHFAWVGNTDEILDEVEEFVTGARRAADVDRVLATILFTDIVGSTDNAVRMGDRKWREVLDSHHAIVREQLRHYRGREIDTAGDGFLAAFDGPARAVRCASAISRAVQRLGIQIRAGVHTGECEVMGDKLSGIAVHTGARIAALAEASDVLVSGTVRDLVAGSDLKFEDRGMHKLKGVPGDWKLYAVETA